MSRLSRRRFVADALTVPLVASFGARLHAQPLTRYDATSAEGKAMLLKYAKAIARMKALGDGDPRSWTFQWYTHAVMIDAQRRSQKTQELMRVYNGQTSANASLAREMWDTCQAHHPGNMQEFFLPWHRMYVYYFERIVRSVLQELNEPDAQRFTLPYWDTATSDTSKRGIVPPEFRNETDPVLKALFRSDRNDAAKAGRTIDPNRRLNYAALSEPDYRPSNSRSGFNDKTDGEFHGGVHVQVGNGSNMGDVPWAARDPLFWLHHCNVDRLWASWENNGGRNPTGNWLTQPFVFADEKGVRVQRKVDDFKAIGPLGYAYERLEPRPGGPQRSPSSLLSSPRPIAGASTAIALGPDSTRVTLPLPQAVGPTRTLTERVSAIPAERQIFLQARNLTTTLQPGTLFNLYLDVPLGTSGDGLADHYLGTINFFESSAAAGRNFSFDVTPTVRRLQQRGRLAATPVITIMPEDKPSDSAKPLVGALAFVEQ